MVVLGRRSSGFLFGAANGLYFQGRTCCEKPSGRVGKPMVVSFQASQQDVSENRGTPKWMVKIMEHPIKMDDLGEKTIFLETPNNRGPTTPFPTVKFLEPKDLLSFPCSISHHKG